jgi:hypothetical protein
MKYLFLLNTPDGGVRPDQSRDESIEMFRAYRAAIDAMAEAGVLIDCAPLALPSTATTVRVRAGETILTDGPAAEIKEQVGGYTLVECADLDDALKWAATIPAATLGSVEVRPILAISAPE